MTHWKLLPSNEKLAREIAEAIGTSSVTAQLLLNRGVSSEEASRKFLYPTLNDLHDPFSMADMDKAVMRIITAMEMKERITIFGDYDTDGATSTALLIRFFEAIGYPVDYYIPHRVEEGYGLRKSAIDKIKERGTNLIITVDNGVVALEQIDHASKIGLDVIVTDHHMPGDTLPKAVAVVDPKRDDCKFPFKELAGVGVAFNLLMALRKTMREVGYFNERPEPGLRSFLDLVALGTVADVVPLVDENRVFVKFGLDELRKSTNRGITALKIVSSLENFQITTHSIAFRLSPRINAAGRVDDQNLGVELLTSDDPEKAASIAERLHLANINRQSIEGDILNEALALVEGDEHLKERKAIVVHNDSWHPGVIGIVASKLVDRFARPAIVLSKENGKYRGSARSIGSYDILTALKDCGKCIEQLGGHRHAAGVVVKPEMLDEFKKRLEEIVAGSIKEEDLKKTIIADAVVDIDSLDEETVEEFELLEPFGEGNPEPVFICEEAKVAEARIVGTNHLKLKIRDDLITVDAIGYSMGGTRVKTQDLLDIAYVPTFNTWNGIRSVQLKLKDLRASS